MKQELIKQIVKVGNSAGVILPREWLNGKARIELIEKAIQFGKAMLEKSRTGRKLRLSVHGIRRDPSGHLRCQKALFVRRNT